MEQKQPTIYDVAKKAGVSIATVSRGLSGGSISAASLRKVEEAAAELGYRPVSAQKAESESRPREAHRRHRAVLGQQPLQRLALAGGGGARPEQRLSAAALLLSGRHHHLRARGGGSAGSAARGGHAGRLHPGGRADAGYKRPADAFAAGDAAGGHRPPIEGFNCPRLTSDPAACVRKPCAIWRSWGTGASR